MTIIPLVLKMHFQMSINTKKSRDCFCATFKQTLRVRVDLLCHHAVDLQSINTNKAYNQLFLP